MENYIFYSYLAAAVAYGLLLVQAYFKHNRHIAFIMAVMFSIIWVGSILAALSNFYLLIADTLFFETLRNGAWFFYLAILLAEQRSERVSNLILKSPLNRSIGILILLALAIEAFNPVRYWVQSWLDMDPRFVLHVVFAILGLILVEQLYRNALLEQRWHLKFLCLGLGMLFVVDLVAYSKSLLFLKLDFTLWQSRGLINTLLVPLLAIASNRLAEKKIPLTAPRRGIFYTTILFGCGAYFILMALVGFYIRQFDAVWGETAQTVFIFLAVLLLVLLFTSGKIRALAKIYFNKHFFHYSYDYRDEWLKLSKALASLESLEDLKQFVIITLADLVESSGGGLWLRNDAGNYYLAQQYNLGFEPDKHDSVFQVKDDHSLPIYLTSKRWVIDFVELSYDPEIYADIDLSAWCYVKNPVWLIIPILRLNYLEGFVVLTKARVPRKLNWEDHDLLKTVAMQLANALALSRVSDELTSTRQFEAYNQLSAYLVHDLKNLVAQITLIVKNAQKHKRNPEFIDDVIDTLQNVATKMQHIVGQLKQGSPKTQALISLNLVEILYDVQRQQVGSPTPQITVLDEHCWVAGDKIKLTAILGHLVQNAQDATNADGWIRIELSQTEQYAQIKIRDNGIGMDQKFIAERLFKPFDTTKGNAGMGIGAYEVRNYVLTLNGMIDVESNPGQGTTFTIQLPLVQSDTPMVGDLSIV